MRADNNILFKVGEIEMGWKDKSYYIDVIFIQLLLLLLLYGICAFVVPKIS